MATSNMNNLTTLIKRLEAATSRLEDIATSSAPDNALPTTNGVSAGTPSGPAVVATNSQALTPTPSATPGSPIPKVVEELPAMLEDFDGLINGDLKAYHELSKAPAIGGLIGEQSDSVVKAFEAQRQFLLLTTKARKPETASPAYMETLKDLQVAMTKVDDVRQSNRQAPVKDQLALVADGVGALGWITFDVKPADAVTDLFGGAQMYGNKVLKLHKEGDKAQVGWVKSFYQVMRSLIAYIKQHHARGVQWNAKGVEAIQAMKDLKSGSSATSSAPPPPPLPPAASGGPPPPPPPPPGGLPPIPKSGGADLGAMFADLNKGDGVTKGLKKVDASQMTHKNPSLRTTSTVPTRSDSSSSTRGVSPAPPKKAKPESLRTKKPPKMELDGSKWIIENFDSPTEPLEIYAEINHSILITKCKSTTLRIHGKANAISIDSSPKFSLVLDSLVSAVDVIKCASFAVQILDKVPTILLDQVDGASIYLGRESLATEVFTSKCSGVNVNLPPEGEDGEGDYRETPVPEQLRTWVEGGRLRTEIVEHAG